MLLTIVTFVFVLSVVVIVHEFGHFAAGKLNGIYVITFSIGFGPKILKKRIGETEYAISLLPFGGYVKFAGETGEEEGEKKDGVIPEDIPEDRFYNRKNPWQRISVVLAGPFMNAVAALLIYILSVWFEGIFIPNTSSVITSVAQDSPAELAGFMPGDRVLSVNGTQLVPGVEISDLVHYDENTVSTFVVRRVTDTLSIDVSPAWNEQEQRLVVGITSGAPPRIGDVQRDGPAWEAGMRPGALVLSVNDTTVTTYYDLQELIHSRLGVPLRMRWIQGGDTLSADITPEGVDAPAEGEKLDVVKVGAIGINEYYDKQRVSFSKACVYGSRTFTGVIEAILRFLGKFVTGGASIKAVGGPIRVGVMAGDMVRWGFVYLMSFIAFFSVNLAIFNLLPIVPFDGGHFVLFLFEGITGRRPGKKAQELMSQIGFILLIALMAAIFLLDIFNLFR
jgi:regulator of sigma E protease